MHLPFLIKQTPETLTTFRELVELDLIVLSFVQNYDLLKYAISGSNRQKVRTFGSGSASAPKNDVLTKKKRVLHEHFLSC